MLNSVSKDISTSILFAESAAEIWKDIEDRFQQSNGPRIFQLRRDLITLRQNQDLVSVYFTKLKALWEELNQFRPMCSCSKCSCNGVKKIEEYIQMDYTMAFLMGLNDFFAQIRSQVLLLEPLPPMSRVFALVIQEERQRAIGHHSNQSHPTTEMAFVLKGDHPQNPNTHRTQQRFQKGRPFCTSCNIHGHTMETCYKIHGYPPGYKHCTKHSNKNSFAPVNQVSGQNVAPESHEQPSSFSSNTFQTMDNKQMEQLMTMFVQHLAAPGKRDDQQDGTSTQQITGTCFSISVPSMLLNSHACWIVDSGATRHICSNANAFISLNTIDNSREILPNHEHVEDIKSARMIGKGKKLDGLYILDAQSSFMDFSVNQVGIQVWHNRLGHPSTKVLQTLNSHLHFGVTESSINRPCDVCPLAKQRRLSFVS